MTQGVSVVVEDTYGGRMVMGGCGCGCDGLEENGAHATHLALFLDEDLKVLVDDGHSKQNTRSRSNGT